MHIPACAVMMRPAVKEQKAEIEANRRAFEAETRKPREQKNAVTEPLPTYTERIPG